MEELMLILSASEKAVDDFLNNPTEDKKKLVLQLNEIAQQMIKAKLNEK